MSILTLSSRNASTEPGDEKEARLPAPFCSLNKGDTCFRGDSNHRGEEHQSFSAACRVAAAAAQPPGNCDPLNHGGVSHHLFGMDGGASIQPDVARNGSLCRSWQFRARFPRSNFPGHCVANRGFRSCCRNSRIRLGIRLSDHWRLFCVIEGVLDRSVLQREVENIWQQANRIVWTDREHNRMKYTSDFVDVSREPQQTIFPLDARKTYELSPITGYAFVRYVNRTVPRMQIVQRQESGWVNWGTNGENEYPEMPSGSTIMSAYGRFANLEEEAARMQTPLVAAPGLIERFYPL